MDKLEPMNFDEESETLEPTYVSKEGFTTVQVRRGFTEIENLFNFLNQFDAFICGGYVRYMCSTAESVIKAGDCDIYFKTEEDYNKAKNILKNEYKLKKQHENDVSMTFNKVLDPEHEFYGSPVIQLIKPVKEGAIVAVGTMETILENFDFTVIRCGLIDQNMALVDADFEHDEPRHLLRLKNIHCPISSTLRCMKYAKKGYWLTPMQSIALFLDWDRRDDEYKTKIINFVEEASKGEGLSRKEVEEMEALMRID